jgi:hypothetical protein
MKPSKNHPAGIEGLPGITKREHFIAAYEGQAPWDIGRPQEAFVRLADSGQVHGSVLDVGCGTGDNLAPRSPRRS